MTYLTFPQFQASKQKVADLEAATGCEGPGLLYADNCYILEFEEEGAPAYDLIISNMEWSGSNLSHLERILWAMHYLPEQGVDSLLDDEDGTLDDYVVGLCDAHGKPVDGDYFGIMFSDVSKSGKWTVAEARDIVLAAFTAEYYGNLDPSCLGGQRLGKENDQ